MRTGGKHTLQSPKVHFTNCRDIYLEPSSALPFSIGHSPGHSWCAGSRAVSACTRSRVPNPCALSGLDHPDWGRIQRSQGHSAAAAGAQGRHRGHISLMKESFVTGMEAQQCPLSKHDDCAVYCSFQNQTSNTFGEGTYSII